MGPLSYTSPMALQYVPILLTVLLAGAGSVACMIGQGWATQVRSRGITVLGVALIALSIPASALGMGSAVAWLVGASFAMITASSTMLVGLTMLAYTK